MAFATGNEGAAMCLRERLGNRQTETESAIAALECALALFERVENTIHNFRFDPDAGVVDSDGEELWLGIGRRNRDLPVLGGNFDSVLKQVPNDLLELRRVAQNMMRTAAQVEMQFQIARLRFRAANFHYAVDNFVSIERPKSQLQFVFPDASDIQKTVEKRA